MAIRVHIQNIRQQQSLDPPWIGQSNEFGLIELDNHLSKSSIPEDFLNTGTSHSKVKGAYHGFECDQLAGCYCLRRCEYD